MTRIVARVRPLVGAVTVAAVLATGCGDGTGDGAAGDAAPTGSAGVVALSDDQAARLAQVGYDNLLAGGARFEGNSAFLAGDATETVSVFGEVDWAGHSGRVIVRAEGVDAGVTDVFWDRDAVYERRPDMDALIVARGGPAEAWIARPADPSGRQLDRLLAIVAALAAMQPENALLIQQTPGSGFLRTDELRATAVDVLRYGERNLYWIAQADGALLRFEGNSAGGNAPTVVDIVERRTVSIPPPPADVVVPVAEIAELYDAFIVR